MLKLDQLVNTNKQTNKQTKKSGGGGISVPSNNSVNVRSLHSAMRKRGECKITIFNILFILEIIIFSLNIARIYLPKVQIFEPDPSCKR